MAGIELCLMLASSNHLSIMNCNQAFFVKLCPRGLQEGSVGESDPDWVNHNRHFKLKGFPQCFLISINLSLFTRLGQNLVRKFRSQVIARQAEHFDEKPAGMKKRRVEGFETLGNSLESLFAKGGIIRPRQKPASTT